MVSPGQFLVEVYPKAADCVGWRNKGLVQGDNWAYSLESEVYRGALLGVNFGSPSTEPTLEGVEVLLEV